MTMEKFTAAILNKKHGAIIMPDAHICVPFGWHSIVSRMLTRVEELPTDIRAFLIVSAVQIDTDGLLNVGMVASPPHMPPGGWEQVEDIIADARNEAAWSCIRDHRPAWIVHTGKGFPRPLCPECQQSAGLKVECHHA
jgi:hypothetical protein